MLALASALALIAVACGGSGGGSPKGPEGYGFPVQEFPEELLQLLQVHPANLLVQEDPVPDLLVPE